MESEKPAGSLVQSLSSLMRDFVRSCGAVTTYDILEHFKKVGYAEPSIKAALYKNKERDRIRQVWISVD